MRRNAASCSSDAARSCAPASRIASVTAASDSTVRSASTARISGLSISAEPNACRYVACQAARRTASRIPAAEPSALSSRVHATISMIVRTPRPSSPTRKPIVPSNSGSDEALERLPSLSLRRWIANGLREPSGRIRGTRKQVTPAAVWASTRNRSHIGALVNHLCPVRE